AGLQGEGSLKRVSPLPSRRGGRHGRFPCQASFKKSVSSHRSFLLEDIRDGLGHLLVNLL
ncbi:unnamed protein product, partial [Scytosiphon promiscuus]